MTTTDDADPTTAPAVPAYQRLEERQRVLEEIAKAHDPVGVGNFIEATKDGHGPHSVTLKDGTVISRGGSRGGGA